MNRIAAWAIAALVAILYGCGGPAPATAPRVETAAVDVSSRNLPIEQELDALLAGRSRLRLVGTGLRVAVPPFYFNDKLQEGNPVAALGAAQLELLLGGMAGVSLLERQQLGRVVDELRKGVGERELQQAASAAKVLQTDVLVIGSVVEIGSDRYRVFIRVVHLRDGGAIKASMGLETTKTELTKSLDRKADELAAALELSGSVAKPPAALPAGSLELAARARELQYQGRLLDARLLYAQALGGESGAIDFELDYVRLLHDLGMNDLADDRVDRVLARVAATDANACLRARLTASKLRAKETPNMEVARQAVMLAGRCGEPSVVQEALIAYAYALEPIDWPAARYVFEKADALVGSSWLRCNARYELLRYRADLGLDWNGDRSGHFEKIAEECHLGGNDRIASIALEAVARSQWTPKERLSSLEKVVERTRRIGGRTHDQALIAMQRELRAAGRVSAADDILLEQVVVRLRAIAATAGGLPPAEVELDRDFRKRAGLSVSASVKEPVGEVALVVRAHRIALASMVEEWAARTEEKSHAEAIKHREGADRLAPRAVKRVVEGASKLEPSLEAARLPLLGIERATEPPLRNSGANVEAAFNTLAERLVKLELQGISPEERRKNEALAARLVSALQKLAGWRRCPSNLLEARLAAARLRIEQGNHKLASADLADASDYVKDSPWETREVLRLTDQIRRDSAVRRERAELARRTKSSEWIADLHRTAYAAVHFEKQPWASSVKPLLDGIVLLESREDFESAAKGVALAVGLLHENEDVRGSDLAVQLYRRRVRIVDKLSDPVRSVQARLELLDQMGNNFEQREGGARRALLGDVDAKLLVVDIETRLDELVAHEGHRAAAHVLFTALWIHLVAPQLTRRAVGWLETFRDSLQYPSIAAIAHSRLMATATSADEYRALAAKARDLYVQAVEAVKDRDRAVANRDRLQRTWMQKSIILATASEPRVWTEVDRCYELAGDEEDNRRDCVLAVAAYLTDEGYKFGRREVGHLRDAGRLELMVRRAVEDLPRLDRTFTPGDRLAYRRNIAAIASAAGDHRTAERMVDESRSEDGNRGEGTWTWDLWPLMLQQSNIDATRAASLAREFASLPPVSEEWRATDFWKVAWIAERGAEPSIATHFLRLGREAASKSPGREDYVFFYDVHPARAALRARDWRTAATAFGKAAAATRVGILRSKARSAQAAALAQLDDSAGALRALEPELAAIPDEGGGSDRVCASARMVELAGALAMASGRCPRGQALRSKARALRSLCKAWLENEPLEEQRECDVKELACTYLFEVDETFSNACRQPPKVAHDLVRW